MRCQLWLFCNHSAVNISYFIACFVDDSFHFQEKFLAVRSGKSFVRIREIVSNIRKACGAQHGVHDGMKQYIGIAVPQKASGICDAHAAQHERPGFIIAMNVIALSDAERKFFFLNHLYKSSPICRGGYFEKIFIARHNFHRYASPLQNRSIIGDSFHRRQIVHSLPKQSRKSPLRRLGPIEPAPIRGRKNSFIFHFFDGIHARKSHSHGGMFLGNSAKRPVNGISIHKRTGSIVDQHFFRSRCHHRKPISHRVHPSISTRCKFHRHMVRQSVYNFSKNCLFFFSSYNNQL